MEERSCWSLWPSTDGGLVAAAGAAQQPVTFFVPSGQKLTTVLPNGAHRRTWPEALDTGARVSPYCASRLKTSLTRHLRGNRMPHGFCSTHLYLRTFGHWWTMAWSFGMLVIGMCEWARSSRCFVLQLLGHVLFPLLGFSDHVIASHPCSAIGGT